ncbi:MAG: LytTR family DNA-binding domain-containing protein, partial [Bacteroidota bacterium]
LLVDDERPALKLLEAYVSKLPHLEVAATCENALQAIAALEQHKVDILFLDIQMPELTGLELLKLLPNRPPVILTTAYRDYAVEGFSLSVTDYLVKPFSLSRFVQAVNKATDQLSAKSNAVSSPSLLPARELHSGDVSIERVAADHFFVRVNYKLERVIIADIVWIEGMREYIRIHTADRRIMTNTSLSKILEVLPADRFLRIHRSHIVNLDRIEGVNGNQVLIADQELPVGKRYREGFFERLRLL